MENKEKFIQEIAEDFEKLLAIQDAEESRIMNINKLPSSEYIHSSYYEGKYDFISKIEYIRNEVQMALFRKITDWKQQTSIVKMIRNPSEDLQLYIMHYNPIAITSLKKFSLNSQKALYKYDKEKMAVLKEIDSGFQMEMVKKDVSFIRLIKNQTLEVKKYAMSKNIQSFEYIKNPSYEMGIEALKQSFYFGFLIKNITMEHVSIIMSHFRTYKHSPIIQNLQNQIPGPTYKKFKNIQSLIYQIASNPKTDIRILKYIEKDTNLDPYIKDVIKNHSNYKSDAHYILDNIQGEEANNE